jgi:hypothetical protein
MERQLCLLSSLCCERFVNVPPDIECKIIDRKKTNKQRERSPEVICPREQQQKIEEEDTDAVEHIWCDEGNGLLQSVSQRLVKHLLRSFKSGRGSDDRL